MNDQFGFFVCGGAFGACPPNGGQNVACVPPTPAPPACATGVSIDNVNSGSNPAFYFDNPGGVTTQYDGFTRNLQVTLNVVPLTTYTITLAIADLGDGIYDSGVFISPFQTPPSLQTITTNGVPTPLCPGDNFLTNFLIGQCPFQWYWVQLSDANGVFPPVPPPGATVPNDPRPAVGTAGNIGNQTPPDALTDIPSQIPLNTPAGTNYQIRVVGYAANSNTPGSPYSAVVGTTGPNILTVQPNITADGGPDQNLCVTTTTLDGNFFETSNPASNLAPFGPFSASWQFVSGPTTPTITGTDPVNVSGMNQSGTYIFQYAVDGPCNDPADQVSIQVTLPVSDFSPVPTLCVNNTTPQPLQATPAGGTFAGPGVSGSNFTPSLAGVGTHTLTYSGLLNGCAYLTTTVVTVNPTPVVTATSNAPICEANTLQFTANAPAGSTFNWTGPNGFSSALQNPAIPMATTAATGLYQVQIQLANCTSAPFSLPVTVFAYPATPNPSNNGPLCAGSTLQLNTQSVAGGTFSWLGPNGFVSAGQNPVIPNVGLLANGEYSVTVTQNGCTSGVGTTVVTIFPIPQITLASSNAPVCVGDTLRLFTDSDATGVPTYTWFGPASFVSQVQNPEIYNVTAANGGIYSVSVTANGCTSPIQTVNVQILPLPIAQPSSNSPVCEGQTLQLFSSSLANGSYLWTGPAGFSSSLQNPVINNVGTLQGGQYTLVVTNNTTGCASLPVDLNVVINPLPPVPTASNSGPLCVGGPLLLTAISIPGATYSWTGPNSFTSNQQSPIISPVSVGNAGTYTVLATVNGCVSPPATTTVTITPNPSAPIIGNNGPICEGQTLQLTSNFIPGATYYWSGENGFVSNVQNPVIPNASTIHTDSYYLYVTVNGCTSPVATMAAVVKPIPPSPIATNNGPSFCAGETIQLAATPVAGASYMWTGPNGFVSTLLNPQIVNATTSASGTYTIVATVNGCSSAPGTTTVVVRPRPARPLIGNNGPICEGATLQLTAQTFPAGTEYIWSGEHGFMSSAQNPQIINVTTFHSDTYFLYVVAEGCTSQVATTFVTVKPKPDAPFAGNNSPVCEGGTVNLSASTVGGASYQWLGPNNFSSTFQNPTLTNVTLAMSGTYVVRALRNGCFSDSAYTTVVVKPRPPRPTVSSNSPVCRGSVLNLLADSGPGVSYYWVGPNGFQSSQQNPVIANAQTYHGGTYTVTAMLDGCASQAAVLSVVVFNNNLLTPAIGSNSPVCEGGNLQLTAGFASGATYAWSGPNGFSSSTQNPVLSNVSVSASGVYSLVVLQGSCISQPRTVSVTVRPRPVVGALGSNAPLCVGQVLNLTAEPLSGVSYSWTGPNGFAANMQNPSIFNAGLSNSGVYSLTVTRNGCSSTVATTTVLIQNPPNAPVATNNGPLCAGQTLQLTASTVAGASYLWSGPGGFSSTAQNPTLPGVSSMNAGIYTVVAVVAPTCTSAAGATEVLVPAYLTPTANFVSNSLTLCEGESTELKVQVSGKGPWQIDYTANGIAQAPWNVGSGGSASPSTFNITVTPTTSTTYTITGVQGLGVCFGVANSTVVVNVNPRPTASFVNNIIDVCAGQTANLDITLTGKGPWTVEYTVAGNPMTQILGNSGSPSPVVLPLVITPSATLTYSLTKVTDGNGCVGTASGSLITRYNLLPKVNLLGGGSTCTGGTVTIYAQILDAFNTPWVLEYLEGSTPKTVSGLGNSTVPIVVGPLTATTTISLTQIINANAPNCARSLSNTLTIPVTNGPSLSLSSTGISCVNSSGTITATASGGQAPYQYALDGGAFGSSNVFTNVSAGTHTVTVKDAAGCSTTASTTVTASLAIPQIISITNITNVSALVNWTAVPGALYRLRYKAINDPVFTFVSNLSNTSYTLINLNPNTEYIVQVEAYCASSGLESGPSEEANFTTLPDAPTCPSPTSISLSAVSGQPTQIQASWTPVAGAVCYQLQYAKTGEGFQTVVVTGSQNPFILPLTVEAGASYQARIRAICVNCEAGPVSNFSPTANYTAPTGNCNFTVRINDGQSPVIFCGQGVLQANVLPAQAGATYQWQLNGNTLATGQTFVVNQSGNYTVTVSVPGCAPITSALFMVTIDTGDFMLVTTAQHVSCTGCTDGWIKATALVSSQTIPEFEYSIVGPVTRGWQDSNYFYNLPEGTYTVRARIKGSTCVVTRTEVVGPPIVLPTPQITSITNILSNRATVNWTAVSNAASYSLRYRVVGSGAWVQIDGIVGITRILTNLQHNTQYEVQVQAKDSNGNTSLWSNTQTFTTPTIVASCVMPGGIFTSTVNATAVLIKWNTVANAACYDIDYRISGAWITVNVPAPATSFNLTGLTAGATYQLRMRTQCGNCNGVSTSTYSNVLTFTQPAARLTTDSNPTQSTVFVPQLYPNPNKGAFTLAFTAENTETLSLKLYDLTGRVLLQQSLLTQIGLNNIPFTIHTPGIYLLDVQVHNQPHKKHTLKVIVQ